ncbi:MAG: hypothetical protein QM804_02650 [Propionicimonas sp.]
MPERIVTAVVLAGRIGAARQQQVDDLGVASHGGDDQRGVAQKGVVRHQVGVGAVGQQHPCDLGVALVGRPAQRGVTDRGAGRSEVRTTVEQKFHHVRVGGDGSLQQRCPSGALVATLQVVARGQPGGHLRQVTLGSGLPKQVVRSHLCPVPVVAHVWTALVRPAYH